MHVIVSLMASEIGGAGGSARFSLSYFIPNSQEGPLLICFGSGSDAERHLNGHYEPSNGLLMDIEDKMSIRSPDFCRCQLEVHLGWSLHQNARMRSVQHFLLGVLFFVFSTLFESLSFLPTLTKNLGRFVNDDENSCVKTSCPLGVH